MLLFNAPDACVGQTPARTLGARLEIVFDSLRDVGQPFNGVLAVLDSAGITFEHVEGLANFELGVPLTRESTFRIASLSKMFAGATATKLAEAGQLDLDAPIAVYLPGLAGTRAGEASVAGLLDHTSGIVPGASSAYLWDQVISAYPWSWRTNQSHSAFVPDTFIARMAMDGRDEEEDRTYRYCNECYVLAGAVMAAAVGKPYEDLLTQEVLQPLGMRDTRMDGLDLLLPGRAFAYERAVDGAYPITRWRNLAPLGPAGGMVSTLPDLAKWVTALFFAEPVDQQVRGFVAGAHGYHRGLQRRRMALAGSDSTDVIDHTGQIAGTFAWIAHFPEYRRAVIALSNIGFTFPQQAFMRAVANAVRPAR